MASAARYLARYGAEETRELVPPPKPLPAHVIVVPAYAEDTHSLDRVFAHLRRPACVIAVINAPIGAPPDLLKRTQVHLQHLGAVGPLTWRTLETRHCRHPLLVVDRTTQSIPRKHGVGGARKIGMDLGLQCMEHGWTAAQWLHTTDADAVLPEHYLDAALPDRGLALYPFRHVSDDPLLARRAALYEAHMHHYRRQLERAGSPYAYTALGSCLTVHRETYVAVRGMPKRDGAEDFHFANKASKVAPVTTLANPEITLNARLSNRVPFGTGPALASAADDASSYFTYNPAIFDGLARLLDSFEGTRLCQGWEAELADQLGCGAARTKLERQFSGSKLISALHIWFDALKTLRFVHLAQDIHANVPLSHVSDKHTDPACAPSHFVNRRAE